MENFSRALGSLPVSGTLGGHGPAGLMNARAPSSLEDAVIGSLRRRPQTASQLARALGRTDEELGRILGTLEDEGRIVARDQLGAKFYSLAGA
jgi:hypothetical protein